MQLLLLLLAHAHAVVPTASAGCEFCTETHTHGSFDLSSVSHYVAIKCAYTTAGGNAALQRRHGIQGTSLKAGGDHTATPPWKYTTTCNSTFRFENCYPACNTIILALIFNGALVSKTLFGKTATFSVLALV